MWEEFEILDEDLAEFKFLNDGVKPEEQEWSAAWTRIRTQSALVVWPKSPHIPIHHSANQHWLLGHVMQLDFQLISVLRIVVGCVFPEHFI